MTRASLSQLISTVDGIHLLWIHQLALYWLLATWLAMLWWLGRGLWRWRERGIERARRALDDGISSLAPLLPSQKFQKKKVRWGKKKTAEREEQTAESQIRHAQEGEEEGGRTGVGIDLEAAVTTISTAPLPPSIYNLNSSSRQAYPNINALHPLPPSAHPHTPYAPSPSSSFDRGLRLRTVMVSNVPVGMRSESELKEYFEYYMSRPILVPPISPGYLPRIFNWFLHRKPARAAAKRVMRSEKGWVMGTDAKRFSNSNPLGEAGKRSDSADGGISTPPNGALKRDGEPHEEYNPTPLNDPHVGRDFAIIDSRPDTPNILDRNGSSPLPPPIIEKVVICRKMTEISSRLERREEYLRKLESAHCKLATKVLEDVKEWIESGGKRGGRRKSGKGKGKLSRASTASNAVAPSSGKKVESPRGLDDLEAGKEAEEEVDEGMEEGDSDSDSDFDEEKEQARMELLARELGPFIEEFYKDIKAPKLRRRSRRTGSAAYGVVKQEGSDENAESGQTTAYPPGPISPTKTISKNRSKPQRDFIPTSTAFVTFHSPKDARRCVRYLPNHPDNLLACMVEPAPDWRDLDWIRIGRSTFTGEFLRDWIVKAGIWGFTLFWIIPVGALVALVSVDKISTFIPGLARYLDQHPYQKEVITAFLPTLIVALLAILVPLLLLLIGKQAHTILTLSKLHDTIMVRYYKFLVCNVLVFFCVGTTTLNAILDQLKLRPGGGTTTPTEQQERTDFVRIVATSFPNAAPFYVGWLVFQTAMHSGLELGLYGLPLMVYPGTRASSTLRRREVGIRPRTYNFYYWLPNHVMVMMIVIVFTILNPLVIPFSFIYFSAAAVVHKNQLMRVYSKWYDQNGTVILVRILRYSLDGFIFAEIVFLALNILTKRSNPGHDIDVLNANFALTGILLLVTIGTKLYFTTVLRAKFDQLDVKEADVYHNPQQVNAERGIAPPEQPSITKAQDVSEDAKLLENTQETPKVEEDQDEHGEPSSTRVDYHPGSVRLWNLNLAEDEEHPYRTLPAKFGGKPASPRGAIPFDMEPQTDDENVRRARSTISGRSPPTAFPRRWSVGAVGVGGVNFPKDVTETLESPVSPTTATTATTATSTMPLLAQIMHARQSIERGEEATFSAYDAEPSHDPHSPGRPGIGRATISFDTPPVIQREKKQSNASSAKSAPSRSTGSRTSPSIRSWIELPAPNILHLPREYKPREEIPVEPISLIQSHPKTGPWDDAPRYDIPYHNPAYTCTMDDFLWLPRNPCGKLNLDDSIEMRKAIRTESQLGALGQWVDDGTSFDVIPRNTVASQAVAPGTIQNPNALTLSSVGDGADAPHPLDDVVMTEETERGIPLSRRITTATTSSRYTRRLLNGMEHIHLPSGIRARLPKKAVDEFGFKRKKWTPPSILHMKHDEEEVEKSEGAEIKERQEGYFTVIGRRSSNAAGTARPRIGSGIMRLTSSASRYPPSTGIAMEGHASTSTLGVRRRRSSRSVFSRYSSNTNSRISSILGTGGTEPLDIAEDPALQPDLSGQSPFADPDLSI
ncbi:hypothetical protein FRC15_001883, partial [Serendipita sp. 397]